MHCAVSARCCRDSPTCSFRRESDGPPDNLPRVSSATPRAGDPKVFRAIIAVGALALIAALVIVCYRASRPAEGGDPHNDIPQLQATQYFDFPAADHRT